MRYIKLLLVLVFAAVLGLYYFIYVMSAQATSFFVNFERNSAKLTRHEIVLPDGFHYAYLEGGHGEPLMLLHGFGADKDNFTRVAQRLTPQYHVIIPDLLGFGESSHPNSSDNVTDFTARAQAERMRALAHVLGIQTLHLGGNSMGGQIALAYAAAHPTEVMSLWLLDPAGVWSAPESELAKLIGKQKHNPLLVSNEDDFAQAFNFSMNKPPYIPRPILNVLAQTSIKNSALSEKIFNQITSDSIEARVTGLKTPTLIVWGDQDRVLNVATAEILYKLMPKSRVVIMPNIGHLPMIEDPQQSAEDYLFFRFKLQAPK
ncbi:alpha/beta fold hydrolase [Solimicrobium silvestre]|uniref:Putative hydrolases or acyltransferases (Alpha/beta hydrolase superfamily) n=1 Tax=Solimicrobium silvestre TaxID=2099400 RepID=A0A2S9GXC4_9BURK|nr:alpha/beta fold hydrolase [Solimicrobium silvestre]PRC92374.1 putative hydrolases or acyltransferases (alpha/beta hydrolase superfamily) [Solimicrobium silvestre]